jgi:hypothetical protein
MQANGCAGYKETMVLLSELIGRVDHDVTPGWQHAHGMSTECMQVLVRRDNQS